jgi:hypothetical protein
LLCGGGERECAFAQWTVPIHKLQLFVSTQKAKWPQKEQARFVPSARAE